jgi:hypothetical protein
VLNIHEGMPSIEHIIPKMRELEFDLAGRFPVNHDGDLRVIEYDAVLSIGNECVKLYKLFSVFGKSNNAYSSLVKAIATQQARHAPRSVHPFPVQTLLPLYAPRGKTRP